MAYQIAIARRRAGPTVFDGSYPTPAAALEVAERYHREDAAGGGRMTGDFVIIPAIPPRTALTSEAVRAAAVARVHDHWNDHAG